jgi:hypothetical protein
VDWNVYGSKRQPKEKMTALMHHLTVATLWQAYDRLKRTAAPGADGVTILHPWPEAPFAVNHPREEPGARIGHAGICAGGAQQWASLPRLNVASLAGRGYSPFAATGR